MYFRTCYIAAAIVGLSFACGHAQTEKARQFDFWIGKWSIDQKILDTDGQWLNYKASTQVEYILEGQALEEHWEGEVKFFWQGMTQARKITGYSIRLYDEEEEKWLIYWMDSLTPKIQTPFKGSFIRPGYGEFFKTTPSPEGNTTAKITFQQQNSDAVLWTLAISKDEVNWTTIWIMEMKRQ